MTTTFSGPSRLSNLREKKSSMHEDPLNSKTDINDSTRIIKTYIAWKLGKNRRVRTQLHIQQYQNIHEIVQGENIERAI